MNGTSISFGVPWIPGEIVRTTALAASPGGKGIPLQSSGWPLAQYVLAELPLTFMNFLVIQTVSQMDWARLVVYSPSAKLHLAPDEPTEPESSVSVSKYDTSTIVTTGLLSDYAQ
jgi:hypothetical protein